MLLDGLKEIQVTRAEIRFRSDNFEVWMPDQFAYMCIAKNPNLIGAIMEVGVRFGGNNEAE